MATRIGIPVRPLPPCSHLDNAERRHGDGVRKVAAGRRDGANDGDAALPLRRPQARDPPRALVKGREPRSQIRRVPCGPRQGSGAAPEHPQQAPRDAPESAGISASRPEISRSASACGRGRSEPPGAARGAAVQAGARPSGGGVGHHGEVVAHVAVVLGDCDAGVNGRLPRCHWHVGGVGDLDGVFIMWAATGAPRKAPSALKHDTVATGLVSEGSNNLYSQLVCPTVLLCSRVA